jgi:ribonucleotide reductase alpha subunit
MSSDTSPGLYLVHNKEFEKLYLEYEKNPEKCVLKKINARTLLKSHIVSGRLESGGPFFCFKDAVNRYSNQMNLGTIQSSNLCTEIVQYTSPTEIAVCTLASVILPKYYSGGETPLSYRPNEQLMVGFPFRLI